jgi:hypothetical protein
MSREWRGLAVCLALICAGCLLPAWTQSTAAVQAQQYAIERSGAVADFPRGVTFSLDAVAAEPPERVELLYRVANDETLHLALPETEVNGTRVRAEELIDLQAEYLPAGLDLRYFWRFHNGDGTWTDSPEQSVRWQDSRFEWRALRSEGVTLYIHDLSEEFGNEILAAAQGTIDRLESTLGFSSDAPISLWVYSNTEALLGAQQTNVRESIAGAAFPEYGLIAAAVPEGDRRELGRVIPHEVSHLMLNQATANPFGSPPLWLDEGLAVYMQDGGKEKFPRTVQRAVAEDRLFALESLAATFPLDPEGAHLAYAQSLGAVTYLLERYGQEGMVHLVESIGEGLSIDDAMTAAVGVDLATFEREWRASLQSSAQITADQALAFIPTVARKVA